MKTLLFLAVLLVLIPGANSQSLVSHNIQVMKPDGSWADISCITTGGNPLLLVFWNANTRECCLQVQALAEAAETVLKPYHVKIVSVFVESGNWAELIPMINGKNWDMEVYIDVNSSMKRALGVPDLPFTYLYDPDMSLVCSHVGYCAGMDDLLCKKVEDCLKKIK